MREDRGAAGRSFEHEADAETAIPRGEVGGVHGLSRVAPGAPIEAESELDPGVFAGLRAQPDLLGGCGKRFGPKDGLSGAALPPHLEGVAAEAKADRIERVADDG